MKKFKVSVYGYIDDVSANSYKPRKTNLACMVMFSNTLNELDRALELMFPNSTSEFDNYLFDIEEIFGE